MSNPMTPEEVLDANTVLCGGDPKRELKGDYSCAYPVGPYDGRCRYWCKVIRAGGRVPMPEDVTGAESIPGDYLRKGEIELFAGDWILEGEANHHVKQRGWTYRLYRCTPKGWTNLAGTVDDKPGATKCSLKAKDALRALRDSTHDKELKSECKQLLLGSGDIAAMCREIHYRRLLTRLESPAIDPDSYCPEHGCPRATCSASH